MSVTIKRSAANSTDFVPWAERSDEELLREYRENANRVAFEVLVQRYERELYSYLRRYLGDAVLAEDAFQATFLQVHLKCDHFDSERKFRPWLYTIATNQAIDAQRRNKRHRMVSLDRRTEQEQGNEIGALMELLTSKELEADSNVEVAERGEWIRAAIEELPETLRTALVLVYYQGMKYKDAAEVLRIPVGTVKSRLHTAILKLHEAWTQTHRAEYD